MEQHSLSAHDKEVMHLEEQAHPYLFHCLTFKLR